MEKSLSYFCEYKLVDIKTSNERIITAFFISISPLFYYSDLNTSMILISFRKTFSVIINFLSIVSTFLLHFYFLDLIAEIFHKLPLLLCFYLLSSMLHPNYRNRKRYL